MKEKQYRLLLGGLLLGVFLVMTALTALTPMLADDFSYSFSYADRSSRISGLGDILASMAAHRRIMNGRVFSHSLAQFFLMLPKPLFDLCNGANAALLLLLLFRFFRGEDRGQDLLLLLCAVFLLWLFMPVFGQVFLWLDGSLNYAWTMSFTLAFLLPFYTAYAGGKPLGGALRPLYVLLAFVAGGYSESASCAALFTAFCFGLLTWLRDRRLPWVLPVGFLSGCAGFLFLMLAPSELGGRTSDFSLGVIAHNIQRMFATPQEALLGLYCLLAALFAAGLVLRVDRKKLISAAVLFAGSVVSVAVYAVAAYFPWRSLCATTFYLLIPCLLLLQGLREKGQRLLTPVLSAVLAVMFLFRFVLGVGDIGVVFYESRQREAAILAAVQAGQDQVAVQQYSGNTKYCASYDLPDLYEDPGQWPNCDVAAYYGIGAVTGVPMEGDYFE